jgi:outer membrane protein
MTPSRPLQPLRSWIAVAASLLTLCTLRAAGQAQPPAQAQPGARFAWVNSQLILPQVPGYAQAESTLTAAVAGYRAEVQRMQTQYDSATADYERQQIALSPSARQTKQQEIRDLQNRLQQRVNALQDRADQRQQELLSPLQQRVTAVIEGLRAERNLSFVFDVGAPGNNIVAADRALDLTSLVVQRLQTPP